MRHRIAMLTVVAILAAGCGGQEETMPGPATVTPAPPTPPVAEIEPDAEPEVETVREVDPAALQQVLDAWAERLEVSALAASVISPEGAITSVGASFEGEAPADSAQFLIGSIGKTMLAATTLLLVEDGVLDLDEPIERWLPEFPRADELTLRLLLWHRAGLAVRDLATGVEPGPAALARFEEIMTPAELLAIAASEVGDLPLPAPFAYSNPGYVVVGGVIEAATGQPLAEVMQTRIFDPLAMADTSLAWPDEVDRLLPGEMALSKELVVRLSLEAARGAVSQTWASGGQVSTTRDVATFFGSIFDGLLSAAWVEAMTDALGGVGLGIEAQRWPERGTGWGHAGGGVTGHTCAAGVTDDGWSATVCMNRFDVAVGDASVIWELFGELIAQTGQPS